MGPAEDGRVTPTQHRVYPASIHTETADVAHEARKQRAESPFSEWRALWALGDGQLAWVRSSVARMDGYIQGEMGHT